MRGRAAPNEASSPQERHPRKGERKSVVLLGLMVGLVLLAKAGAGLGDRGVVETVTYYAPVFNPSGDSIAYLKRTAAFKQRTQALGLSAGHVFEKDVLQLCRAPRRESAEECLTSWELPLEKEGGGGGQIDPAISWETGLLRFTIRTRKLRWHDREVRREAAYDRIRKPERWQLLAGSVVGGRIVAESQRGDPGGQELRHGPTVVAGMIVRASPPAKRRERLRSNGITIEPYVERKGPVLGSMPGPSSDMESKAGSEAVKVEQDGITLEDDVGTQRSRAESLERFLTGEGPR